MKRTLWLAACLLPLVGVGCAYTFNPSSIPGHIKTLEIPVAENQTLEVALAEDVTSALIDRFVNDNTLKVVQGDADSQLEARIVGYENKVFGFNSDQRADEYIVILEVEMTFRDRVKNKELWREDVVRGAASYFPGSTTSTTDTEEKAREVAIKQIVDFAMSKTTEGW